MNKDSSHQLPLTGWYNPIFYTTLFIAILQFLISLVGIIFADTFYPQSYQATFVGNDIANLLFGCVAYAVSLYYIQKENIIGLLCLPGALFYTIYAYFVYLIAVPFGYGFIFYSLLVTLSLYNLILLLSAIDPQPISDLINGKIPQKLFGGILIALGILIVVRELNLIVTALINNSEVDFVAEFTVWIDDFVVAMPALLISGFFLWQGKPIGYVFSVSLFLSYMLLSLALFPIVILKGIEANTTMDFPTIIVLSFMVILCAFPFFSIIKQVTKNVE